MQVEEQIQSKELPEKPRIEEIKDDGESSKKTKLSVDEKEKVGNELE